MDKKWESNMPDIELKQLSLDMEKAVPDEKQRAYHKNHAEKRRPDYWRFQ